MPDWLLIFDDASSFTQISEYIPEQHGGERRHIIITSRNSTNWNHILPLSPFKIEEAVEYITKVTEQKEGARELATLLGCLPLALAQASSYIKNIVPIHAYIKLFEGRHQDLWAEEQECREGNDDPSIYDKYMKGEKGIKLTIKTTLDLSLDAIKKSSDGQMAINILKRSAYLYHEQIPEYLLKESLNQENVDPLKFNRAIKELAKHSIFTANIQKKKESEEGEESIQTYSLHQLTQQIVRDMDEEKKNETVRMLLTNIEKLFPEVKDTPTKEWKEAKLLKNHAETILLFSSNENTKEKGNILEKLGYYEQYITLNYEKSLECSLRELSIYKAINQNNCPDIAKILNHVGYAYLSLGRVKEGLDYLKSSLKMFREIHKGGYHSDVATSLNGVGNCYKTLGNPEKSLDCFREALDISKEFYKGNNHLDVVISLNNVGECYKGSGNVGEALNHLKYALVMCQELNLGNHSLVANILNNIGSVFETSKNLQESLEYYKRALEIFKILYSDTHPCVAMGLNNIGFLYMKLENMNEALPYLKKALGVYETLYRDNHPLLANILNNVGSAYLKVKDMKQALDYTNRAHTMCDIMFGPDHPKTLIVKKNVENIENQMLIINGKSINTNNDSDNKNNASEEKGNALIHIPERKFVDHVKKHSYKIGGAVTIAVIGGFVAYLQTQKEKGECKIL